MRGPEIRKGAPTGAGYEKSCWNGLGQVMTKPLGENVQWSRTILASRAKKNKKTNKEQKVTGRVF